MKKNLRLLCLGLAAAAVTSSFAQEATDMTSLLKNPTMESGIKAWSFKSTKPMYLGNKKSDSYVGYHGISGSVYEAWNGKQTKEGTGGDTGKPEVKYFPALSDGYAMQRLSGLEAGTYVFGVYAGAACQGDSLETSLENVKGVTLFANDKEVRVATNNPEMKGNPRWAHTSKFNVAVTLTDEDAKKGYLDVGLSIAKTNANFILWDNATLYYFGNMSEADALDAMAAIDIAHSLSIADTLRIDTLVMNVDTLANFQAALENARNTTVTAANLWELNEDIYYNKGLVHKSVADYTNFKKNIERVRPVVDQYKDWVDDTYYVELLEELIAEADAAYEAKELNRKELEDLRKELNYAAGDVKYDSLLVVQDSLNVFKTIVGTSEEYTAMQEKVLDELIAELQDTIDDYNSNSVLDIEDRWDPNNLYPYIARVLNTIDEIQNNKFSGEYTQMPIVFDANEDNYVEGTSKNYDSKKAIAAYISPTYRFENAIETFKITVKKANHGGRYFCLSELEFYDANGQPIKLDTTNVKSNAEYNALNPGKTDGGGIEALFDGDTQTYFHSAWENSPNEDHYLEVTFPKGYKEFSFRMISRDNSNGHDQRRTFPAEMVLSTPTPKRDALEATCKSLKDLRAYSVFQVDEVGFYTDDFSYVLDAIAEVEEMLKGYPSETICEEKNKELVNIYNQYTNADKFVSFPEEEKAYRLVSGHPGFYNNQQLEKAVTVNAKDNTLWWETASVDSTEQEFVFIPVLEGGEQKEMVYKDVTLFAYNLKNKKTGLYVSGSFTQVDDRKNKRVKLVEEPEEVYLKILGAGQWQILLKDGKDDQGNDKFEGMDMYDNNGGWKGETAGDYGEAHSVKGVTCHMGPWTGTYGEGSALYIREMSELPLTALVVNGEFKSAKHYHFAAANNIKLTADKDCAFKGLKLYGLLGDTLAIDTIMVVNSKTVHVVTPKDIVGFALGFNNTYGVSRVTVEGYHYVSALAELQAAFNAAVAVAPTQGDSIGQSADITEYLDAVEAAEAMLENGASDDEMKNMIKRLEAAVNGIEFNMPKEGKYYHILTGFDAFENLNGYNIALNANSKGQLAWAPENDVDNKFYWQFERATEGELATVGAPDSICAFFIKNVGSNEYVGGYKTDFESDANLPMASSKVDAIPYVVKTLGNGAIVALDAAIEVLNKEGKQAAIRIHAKGHSSGAGKQGTTTYWGSGLESASAWRIVEVQYDVTDIDFTEVETEKAVVKGAYDLFGRRIEAPAAPGIYIIDGKKKYIKK